MSSRFTRIALALTVLTLVTTAATVRPAHATSDVVISQVYGGGGNAGATLKNDFIELHNRSAVAVSLAGWSVQYASTTGSSWASTALTGTIAAGGYYLVQEAAGSGGVPGPTPDATGTIAMAAGAGKVGLVSSTTLLIGTCPTGGALLDFVGYGSTTNCSEGTLAPTLTNTTAGLRAASGCTDTDNNGSDFASGTPAPRNSASSAFVCPLPQKTLSVTVVGSGSVAKAPDQPTYDQGSIVMLTPTPAAGWHFVGWSGDASGSANPLSVTMATDKAITATFAINTYTLDVTVVGSGSVAKAPDQPTYNHGSSVDLTPTPAAGWHFVGWSGDASGSANPLTVTMDGNKAITATFAINTYTLDVTVVGSGSVAKAPDQPTYDHGSSVDLTATPAVGWHFVAWSGDATGSANPLTVTMDGNKAITATFAIDTHVLTVTTVGSGSVAKAPDQASYDHGSSVDLTATPAVGWHFVAWSGDASGSANPLTVTMDADKSITATFAINTYVLSVTVVGSGSVAKAPDQPTYDHGSSVDLTATPAVGWHFVAWSGDATGPANPLTVTMDGNKAITATFAINTHVLTVTTVGSGSVAKAPDQASYDHGSSVDLTATPAVGWYFVGWSGDASGSANPLTVTMDADKSITATFAINTYVLSVTVVGSGSVAKAPDQPTYNHGSSVDLTATPAVGWHFVGWSGDASGSTNPLTVTMDGNKAITATFAINSYTLSVTVVGSGSVAKAPDQPTYNHGSSVNLTATPAAGWHLVGWSGDATGSANPLAVTMDGNKSITATFEPDPPPALLVISQVYGGGGNAGAPLHNDYIEIFNRGVGTVSLSGWSVQYASAAGSSWSTTALSGSIAPGAYYLVQEAAGTGAGAPLPTPDATGSTAMSATAGKVALVSSTTSLTGACPSGGSLVDLLGYGAASCAEDLPTGGLTNTTADFRKSAGCVDTDHNSLDFTIAAPAPRNSASPLHSCDAVLTVTIDPPGSGTVAKVPDLPSYPTGSNVQLTATPTPGFHFVNWTGDASGSANPLTLLMNAAKTVVAHFATNGPTPSVVISQVYGGGGNAGAPFTHDYVELYNRGNVTVSITGWSLQYAASTGTVWFSTNLIGTLVPGAYYLIEEAAGVNPAASLPTADAIGVINLSASSGKVALVNSGTLLTGNCPSGGGIVDFVGYGAAGCSEGGSPALAMDNVTATFRNSAGCDDSGNNLADFSSSGPAPRNSASPHHICTEWLGVGDGPVAAFALGNAIPNPMRGIARIPFALPRESDVRIEVLDVQGRVVATLATGRLPAGHHEAIWDGASSAGPVRPGLYLVSMRVAGTTLVRRVSLTR